jgi:DNA-directed RNA polymerase specialized sigma24 family protein
VPPSELEDEELVARSLTGDVGAFRGIATRYYSLIYTMAYEAAGGANQSNELARDTFLAAWRRGELFRAILEAIGRLTMFGTAASRGSLM